MADSNDLTDAIVDAASAPASTEVDGLKVQEQDLDKLCRTDSYLARKAAASKKHRGLRFNGIDAPGPMGANGPED